MSKKSMLLAAVLAVAVIALSGIWVLTRPQTSSGEKDLTVQVVHSDSSIRSFAITTSAEYLGEALVDANIVEDNQGPYGLYILTADGETASESKQEWWCLTKGGESLVTGASETPIADGDVYELTFTVGYDF